jgi:hypothetical protein
VHHNTNAVQNSAGMMPPPSVPQVTDVAEQRHHADRSDGRAPLLRVGSSRWASRALSNASDPRSSVFLIDSPIVASTLPAMSGRDGHAEAERRADERLGDAGGHELRVAGAVLGDDVERGDHAGHGAEQAEQRRARR